MNEAPLDQLQVSLERAISKWMNGRAAEDGPWASVGYVGDNFKAHDCCGYGSLEGYDGLEPVHRTRGLAEMTPAGQRWTRRKILAVHGGHYEEYEENYYWVPDDFSWARLADAIQKRKGLLNPDRKKMFFAHEVLERALLAVGCKPVISDLRLCTDGFMVDWDVDDSGEMTRLSYDPINRFTDELLKRGPLTPNEATE